MDLPVVAGMISTALFVFSMLPMLYKALRTKDLKSYSPGNLALSNAGNAVHSVYVFSLPVGPIWLLHSFYVIAAALMLIWYLRYRHRVGDATDRTTRTDDVRVVRLAERRSAVRRPTVRPIPTEVAA
jgi:uncharacterized protein with PQ loop repeat